jgi:hypothetical protein
MQLFNWEANASKPQLQYIPGIIDLLGYNPLPEATSIGGQLVQQRTTLGLTGTKLLSDLVLTRAR